MIQIYILTKKEKEINTEVYNELQEVLNDLKEKYKIKYVLEKIY